MPVLAIAFKDVKKTFRNVFTLVMMFIAPFLITGLLYFAFGRQEEAVMDPVRLGIVNSDEGIAGLNAGNRLIDYFNNPDVNDIIRLHQFESVEPAKGKIDAGELDILLSVPKDFSAQLNDGNPRIDMFVDPAGTVRRDIVSTLVTDYVTTTAGLLSLFRALSETSEQKPRITEESAAEVAEQFVHTHEEEGTRHTTTMLTMCAMTIFFLFFAASVTAQGLITEQEEGTFQRMSVSPNKFSVLLTGKFTGVFLTVTIQSIILLTGATLLFTIRWPSVTKLVLLTLATVISAAGFTIFIMSLVNSTRQVGAVSGAVLTIGGMLGGLFTVGIPNLPPFFAVVNKIVPQGWAITGYRSLLFPTETAIPFWVSVAGTASFGLVFLILGTVIVSRKLR